MRTNKFLELPILLMDLKAKEMGVKTQDVPVMIQVLPDEICAFRTALPDDTDDIPGEKTMIYIKSGESFRLELTLREFKKTFNEFH